jgi:S1-C subfamily serine protease
MFQALVLALAMATGTAAAQETFWVQIEAQPNLREAVVRARAYSGVFGDVQGYRLGSGWYAITLGPYDRPGADARLRELRSERLIPADSFLNDGRNFGQPFWPVGAAMTTTPLPEAPATEPLPPAPDAPVAAAPLPDETPAEARRSESLLDREAREQLQTALQWKGFYSSAIDGAFGPGTRAAMAGWQADRGYDQTGVLTTMQREELLRDWQAALAELGLEVVRDEAAGIEIQLPLAMVEFARYEPPFAQYDSIDGSATRVLLLSQPGDQQTLFGLYDIMQTLEIVPTEGFRERSGSSFVLTGQRAGLQSYTYAELRGGLIKGYTLVWDPADGERMTRVLDAMKASFTPFGDFALDPTEGDESAAARRDLLAGLEIRRPIRVRSGFYVDESGAVLTSADAVAGCGRITLDDRHAATVAATDANLGIAVLRPQTALAPMGVAEFRTASTRPLSEVAAAGFSYGDRIALPTLTFGTLQEIGGLNGEDGLARLSMTVLPGDAGGPVYDVSGAVVGMLLPRAEDGARLLPPDVTFAADAETLAQTLETAGVAIRPADRQGALAPEDLARLATGMTVMVSCWD